jgi:hypothetical protein
LATIPATQSIARCVMPWPWICTISKRREWAEAIPNGDKDTITNIQALCRSCHEQYGDKKQYKDFLKSIHYRVLGIEKATIADDEQHEVTPDGKIIFKHEK